MKTYTVIDNEAGHISWYKEGTNILHRENGPAVEFEKIYKAYWVDGKLHRLDGPAVEYASGSKEYWVDGNFYSKEGFDKKLAELNKLSCDGKVVEIDGKKYKLSEVS